MVEFQKLVSVFLTTSLLLSSYQGVNGQQTFPQRIRSVVLESTQNECPTSVEAEAVLSEIRQNFTEVISAYIAQLSPDSTDTPCGGSGWRRVAFVNMTDPDTDCPTGLTLTSYSRRTCGRASSTIECFSTTFSVGGSQYNQVCGRIRGYQFGATSAFAAHNNSQSQTTIDGYYVDGVSLTHGAEGSRQHIWTFAAGISEEYIRNSPSQGQHCPCDGEVVSSAPSFVGDDYFCESALSSSFTPGEFIFYPDDLLWDGQDCSPSSTCCQLNNPPWFTKTLPSSTTDDIELRICCNTSSGEDIPLELVELYVK